MCISVNPIRTCDRLHTESSPKARSVRQREIYAGRLAGTQLVSIKGPSEVWSEQLVLCAWLLVLA